MLKFRVLNAGSLHLGLSEAVSMSELSLDARTLTSSERRFFRQERAHPRHGRQRVDYYPDEDAVWIECLDVISLLNVLEETGFKRSIVSAIPPAVLDEALRQAEEDRKDWEKELDALMKRSSCGL